MNNPFENTIAVALGFHLMGNRRGVSKTTLKVLQEQQEVPKEMLSLTKRLLDSKEFDAISRGDTDLTAWIKDISIPTFLRRGTYLIPTSMVGPVDDKVRVYMDRDRPVLVDAFLAVYEQRVEEAKEALGPLFDPKQYPSMEDVRSKFWMEYRWESFAPPDSLKDLNPEIYRAARDKIEGDMKEASLKIVQAMRIAMLELVQGLETSLNGKREDGKPVKFYESAVDKVGTFVKNFQMRNVVGDAELEAIVKQAEAVLEGADVDKIRSDTGFRSEIGERMKGVVKELSALVESQGRKFDFSEE